jgi:ElaB/YqjD/DUF883 family membrane-anchored ribosome-binding protein
MDNIFSKEEIIKDFEEMVLYAEALIAATADTSGEKIEDVRNKAEKSLKIAKEKIASAQRGIITKTNASVKASNDYVHENPWRSIGFAASVGTIIGLLIGRR